MKNQMEKMNFELALTLFEHMPSDELLNQCLALSKGPAASKDAFIASVVVLCSRSDEASIAAQETLFESQIHPDDMDEAQRDVLRNRLAKMKASIQISGLHDGEYLVDALIRLDEMTNKTAPNFYHKLALLFFLTGTEKPQPLLSSIETLRKTSSDTIGRLDRTKAEIQRQELAFEELIKDKDIATVVSDALSGLADPGPYRCIEIIVTIPFLFSRLDDAEQRTLVIRAVLAQLNQREDGNFTVAVYGVLGVIFPDVRPEEQEAIIAALLEGVQQSPDACYDMAIFPSLTAVLNHSSGNKYKLASVRQALIVDRVLSQLAGDDRSAQLAGLALLNELDYQGRIEQKKSAIVPALFKLLSDEDLEPEDLKEAALNMLSGFLLKNPDLYKQLDDFCAKDESGTEALYLFKLFLSTYSGLYLKDSSLDAEKSPAALLKHKSEQVLQPLLATWMAHMAGLPLLLDTYADASEDKQKALEYMKVLIDEVSRIDMSDVDSLKKHCRALDEKLQSLKLPDSADESSDIKQLWSRTFDYMHVLLKALPLIADPERSRYGLSLFESKAPTAEQAMRALDKAETKFSESMQSTLKLL
jgi:hypothetical protein